ncbi:MULTISPECIES: DUF2124 domain-containing protein [Methanobacterium]|jgi:hypothetical protein|uniref:DUF2124 domain-containing protein n=1 Tax=Methanobacterium subterraneum TaxID=59277 RepID=A0A7K4DLQ0_9EURY|nr:MULTISPECIES: DUF2124 domain-containing protein [Methanobacterium]AUB58182.1 hypothetical protein BK008_07560 [Methanobacterium sp. MZ-A1]MBW4256826.1 DUF2124 domain-containing protein [Methanobacterium sp. YSL]NMO08735.1 DUF2124 domain-containing protein [Methanobacterium subterraneum]PKL72906.1 MAG: DUF2124 domain-containing protein [Methanobacteriales archaeon HGW-Methanobacteriales-2]
MRETEKFRGLNGNLMAFKKEVEDADKVTFVGIPGVCSPFAELFAYVIRDKESVFVSKTDLDTTRKIERTPLGMQFTEEANPSSSVVALLGGLSMPQYEVNLADVQDMVKEILKPNGKLIGLCYMNMFEKAGWDEKIDFDCIINGVLNGEIYKRD